MSKAAEAIMEEDEKIKTVGREINICINMTLLRFIKKLEAGKEATIDYKKRRLSLMNKRKVIAEYVLKCYSICFSLLHQEIRKLIYEYAIKFDFKNTPSSWHKNGTAGPDWLNVFFEEKFKALNKDF
jgi:hypothetical protein